MLELVSSNYDMVSFEIPVGFVMREVKFVLVIKDADCISAYDLAPITY